MIVFARLQARVWRRAALECAGMTGRCLLAENRALMAAARGRRLEPTDARALHPSRYRPEDPT